MRVPSSDGMYPRRPLPASESPTTRGSDDPVTFMQDTPVQLQGVSSSSFQSDKVEELSTADLRERSERPSGESERVKINKLNRRNNNRNDRRFIVFRRRKRRRL